MLIRRNSVQTINSEDWNSVCVARAMAVDEGDAIHPYDEIHFIYIVLLKV